MLQHKPDLSDGHEFLADMVNRLYTGWGAEPLVVLDISRIADGKFREHWDVVQQEVPVSATTSGRSIFPTSQ
jgi:predicted SnoaL-like aldol condensation-catalyzing enzyme